MDSRVKFATSPSPLIEVVSLWHPCQPMRSLKVLANDLCNTIRMHIYPFLEECCAWNGYLGPFPLVTVKGLRCPALGYGYPFWWMPSNFVNKEDNLQPKAFLSRAWKSSKVTLPAFPALLSVNLPDQLPGSFPSNLNKWVHCKLSTQTGMFA